MSKISVFMADGMEEVECLSIVDTARRAGIEVETVSIMGRAEVTSSHGAVSYTHLTLPTNSLV